MQTSLHSSLPGRGRSITFLVAKNVVYLIHKQCANSELQHTHGKNSTNSIKTAFLSRDDSTSPRTPQCSTLGMFNLQKWKGNFVTALSLTSHTAENSNIQNALFLKCP